jgi:hypothetical protein
VAETFKKRKSACLSCLLTTTIPTVNSEMSEPPIQSSAAKLALLRAQWEQKKAAREKREAEEAAELERLEAEVAKEEAEKKRKVEQEQQKRAEEIEKQQRAALAGVKKRRDVRDGGGSSAGGSKAGDEEEDEEEWVACKRCTEKGFECQRGKGKKGKSCLQCQGAQCKCERDVVAEQQPPLRKRRRVEKKSGEESKAGPSVPGQHTPEINLALEISQRLERLAYAVDDVRDELAGIRDNSSTLVEIFKVGVNILHSIAVHQGAMVVATPSGKGKEKEKEDEDGDSEGTAK